MGDDRGGAFAAAVPGGVLLSVGDPAGDLGADAAAKAIEAAVEKTVGDGIRTGDIKSAGSTVVDTTGMGDAILKVLG